MSIFTTSTNNVYGSSSYDIGCEQSDMDTSESDHDLEEDAPKDYWFGRKYFECVLAQNILQHSRLYENVAQIDSRLASMIQKFPYARSLTQLRAEGLESILPLIETNLEHDPYRLMMFSIGAVVRKGDRGQKAVLLAVLRQQGAPEASDLARPQAEDAHSEANARKRSRKVEGFVDGHSVSSMDLGRYATALKEYSDKHGSEAIYRVDELSRIPPRFQATVVVDGSTYQGTARTKKLARHEAARVACLEMKIEAFTM